MIKHIVFLKSQEKDATVKRNIIEEVAKRLNTLPSIISEIDSLEVGINFSDRDSAYDLALVTSFKNESDLNTYRFHEDHLKVIEYIKQNKLQTAVVDYNL